MAITLTALQEGVVDLPLKLGDDDLLIKYHPGKMTQSMRTNLFRGAAAFVDDNERGVDGAWRRYFEAVASVLVWWDVLGDDGEPLPISAETLADLPLGFIESLISEVAKDSRVNPQIKAISASISPTKEN